MVLGPEAESDCIALGRSDGVRLEDELASLGTDRNLVVYCEYRTGESDACEEC